MKTVKLIVFLMLSSGSLWTVRPVIWDWLDGKQRPLPPTQEVEGGFYVWMKKWIMEEEHRSLPSLSSISPNRLSGMRMREDVGRSDSLQLHTWLCCWWKMPVFCSPDCWSHILWTCHSHLLLPSSSMHVLVTCSFLKFRYQYPRKPGAFSVSFIHNSPSQMLPVFLYCV